MTAEREMDTGRSRGEPAALSAAPGFAWTRWVAVAVLLPAVVVYPAMLLLSVLHRPTYNVMIIKEGLLEFLGVGVLVVGIGFGVLALLQLRHRALPEGWLKWWFALVTLGAFVLAGEEISWGQHLGLWDHKDLPAWLHSVNDQSETNFHNMDNAFDQGPTNLVVFGTLFACFILPLIRRWRKEPTPTPATAAYWFWPTALCLPAAVGVIIIPLPKRIVERITGDDPQILRHSEMHEFYIALLITTYLASVYLRLRARPATAPAGDRDDGGVTEHATEAPLAHPTSENSRQPA